MWNKAHRYSIDDATKTLNQADGLLATIKSNRSSSQQSHAQNSLITLNTSLLSESVSLLCRPTGSGTRTSLNATRSFRRTCFPKDTTSRLSTTTSAYVAKPQGANNLSGYQLALPHECLKQNCEIYTGAMRNLLPITTFLNEFNTQNKKGLPKKKDVPLFGEQNFHHSMGCLEICLASSSTTSPTTIPLNLEERQRHFDSAMPRECLVNIYCGKNSQQEMEDFETILHNIEKEAQRIFATPSCNAQLPGGASKVSKNTLGLSKSSATPLEEVAGPTPHLVVGKRIKGTRRSAGPDISHTECVRTLSESSKLGFISSPDDNAGHSGSEGALFRNTFRAAATTTAPAMPQSQRASREKRVEEELEQLQKESGHAMHTWLAIEKLNTERPELARTLKDEIAKSEANLAAVSNGTTKPQHHNRLSVLSVIDPASGGAAPCSQHLLQNSQAAHLIRMAEKGCGTTKHTTHDGRDGKPLSSALDRKENALQDITPGMMEQDESTLITAELRDWEWQLGLLLERGNGRSVYGISHPSNEGDVLQGSHKGFPSKCFLLQVRRSNIDSGRTTELRPSGQEGVGAFEAPTGAGHALVGLKPSAEAKTRDDSHTHAAQRPPDTTSSFVLSEASKGVRLNDLCGDPLHGECPAGGEHHLEPDDLSVRHMKFHAAWEREPAVATTGAESATRLTEETTASTSRVNTKSHAAHKSGRQVKFPCEADSIDARLNAYPRQRRLMPPVLHRLGDRVAARIQHEIFSTRRHMLALELSRSNDIKRTCDFLQQVKPLRQELLEHGILKIHKCDSPNKWLVKYPHPCVQRRVKECPTIDASSSAEQHGVGPLKKITEKHPPCSEEHFGATGGMAAALAKKRDVARPMQKGVDTGGVVPGCVGNEAEAKIHVPRLPRSTCARSVTSRRSTAEKSQIRCAPNLTSFDNIGSTGLGSNQFSCPLVHPTAALPQCPNSVAHDNDDVRCTDALSPPQGFLLPMICSHSAAVTNAQPTEANDLGLTRSPRMSHLNQRSSTSNPSRPVAIPEGRACPRRLTHASKLDCQGLIRSPYDSNVNVSRALENNCKAVLRAVYTLSEEERRAARLQYLDVLEIMYKGRMPTSTWLAAQSALNDCRCLLLERPHEQTFSGLKTILQKNFGLAQLMQAPTLELSQHLARLFRVSAEDFASWITSFQQLLSARKDYEAKFCGIDYPITRRELGEEPEACLTVHCCRQPLPVLNAAPQSSHSHSKGEDPILTPGSTTPTPLVL